MATGANKRTAPRLEHEVLVAYRTVDGFISDWAVNISKGGLFINTRKTQPVGSTVRLIISLPGTDFPFELSGRVKRVVEPGNATNETPGMALEFVSLDREMRAKLEEFVNTLRQELPDSKKPTS